jgi:hypothetical protein
MVKPSPALSRIGRGGFILLCAACFAVLRATFPQAEPSGANVEVAHNLTSSHLWLKLSGIPSPTFNEPLTNPPPDFRVLDANGKTVASGKFEFG